MIDSSHGWEKIQEQTTRLVVLLPLLYLLVGCGERVEVRLEDYLEEIEYVAPLNSTVEVPIGKYSIPVAAVFNDDVGGESQVTWLRIKFHLYVVVANENEFRVESCWERNRGLYHDGVLNICRSATLDEVTDVRFTAIKLRLVDLSRALLGKENIRQLLCTNIVTEAI